MKTSTSKRPRYFGGPGKHHRLGVPLIELFDMFPDNESARDWFEEIRWPDGIRNCPSCNSENTKETPSGKPQPYWCRDCRKYFSVTVGTVMESSHIPLRKWVIGIYLVNTSLRGINSMQMKRALGITQKSAWFMLHRIREAWNWDDVPYYGKFDGPVEVDETYIGGKERNKHESKKTNAGRGPVGKTAVVGIKDRPTKLINAEVVDRTDRATLQGFIDHNASYTATVYTDDARAYHGMPRDHESVQHSVGEYVREQVHINGMESFWATLKRGYMGTYFKMSPKHLQRYVNEFAGRHNTRDYDTIDQMSLTAIWLTSKRLMYKDLIGPSDTRLT